MEHWTIRRSGVREVIVYMYPELNDLESYTDRKEKRIFFCDLNERIRNAIHVLDAAADEKGHAYLDDVGERNNVIPFIRYRITVEPKEKVIWKDSSQS